MFIDHIIEIIKEIRSSTKNKIKTTDIDSKVNGSLKSRIK